MHLNVIAIYHLLKEVFYSIVRREEGPFLYVLRHASFHIAKLVVKLVITKETLVLCACILISMGGKFLFETWLVKARWVYLESLVAYKTHVKPQTTSWLHVCCCNTNTKRYN